MKHKHKDIQDSVIQKIKCLRMERNISQSALSGILDISCGQIGNIESSKFQHKYTLKQIATFCDFIDFPFEAIFLSEEELKEDNKIKLLIAKIIEYDE